MHEFSSIIVGNDSLTIACARALLARGHTLSAVITENADVQSWAHTQGIPVHAYDAPPSGSADWVISAANLKILGADILGLGNKGALNFHDGPLPRYAGLNAPVWAKLNGETRHGITWHMISDEVDAGDILTQSFFDIHSDDTAFTLNTKCFEAGLTSFEVVLDALESDAPQAMQQDMSLRSYFGLTDRPDHQGVIDPAGSTRDTLRTIRALDHGPYWNPLCSAKLLVGDVLLHIGSGEVVAHNGSPAPGTLLEIGDDWCVVMLGDGALKLRDVRGNLAALSDGALAHRIGVDDAVPASIAKRDGFWRRKLSAMSASVLPVAGTWSDTGWDSIDAAGSAEAWLGLASLISGEPSDVALGVPGSSPLVCPWVPVRSGDDIAALWDKGPFAADLLYRDPVFAHLETPAFGLGDAPVPGTLVTLGDGVLHYDTARVSKAATSLIAARLAHVDAQLQSGKALPDIALMSPADTALLAALNDTETAFDDTPLHLQIEAQAARTPEATAVVVERGSLTYAQLNARANAVAHVLRGMNVQPDTLVGLYCPRSIEMMVGVLGILKAGGGYVPLDPAYPASRIEGYLEDCSLPVILTTSGVATDLPEGPAQVVQLDKDARLSDAPVDNPAPAAGPDNLAYLIFTSGSTGRPKGVMVEHRNLSNFCAGMDDRLEHDPAGTWLAVTSLNFDISVLELIYTLSRGFKVVMTSDDVRALISNGPVKQSAGGMEFSLYYWGNDDGPGPKKYELLLEGAKFADQNGFCAVWTPERHFHAFGGPYPNPSVTGAAVAAVTRNIGVRAGSCVAPLHHPARIAEEWAVIDNLTGGRSGMAIASGWQPDDFILRPENTPPENKPAMMASIETVRKLWRGEAVEFPKADGSPHAVVTQPRPVSKEMPIWVTTAGNPETWKDAGRIGANVLTHLLGQSIDEVAGKIALYHDALRDAGHDPKDFSVTLMLHTFLADTRDEARDIARDPMKDYLRSAAGLIKQYAWAFPAFKRPKGADNAFQIDLETLEADELEGILDFAFQRYFEESGLFGTVQDAMARVESLKAIGVSEIACLIDYGIAPGAVMDGLEHLAQVVARSAGDEVLDEADVSIAAQLVRHDVSHLQCTPSMARMLCMDEDARRALAGVRQIMIGGEALPGALVRDVLAAAPEARITNMYGPTETTIWSSSHPATPVDGLVSLGTPIANTQFHVLDDAGAILPIGAEGELCIGGAGVTRGYWERPDLTQERFIETDHGRLYRTGDLVRITAEGEVVFLGRVDHQIKLRGYRIELGEIEAALEAQAGVTQAVVVAREDTPGDVRLIAYITGRGSAKALRSSIAAVLPDYMVPAHIEILEAFPLTPNKKIDRNALPAPQVRTQVADYSAPITSGKSDTDTGAIEQQIGAIWQRILGGASVSANDNFFDLGGHSLLAVQAHRDIRAQLDVKLSITDIFRFPVLSALAQRVAEQGGHTSETAEQPKTDAAPESSGAPVNRRADMMAKRRAMRAARMGR